MKTVVVTGASTGIGQACALRLDKIGWRVFATVRKPEDGDTLKRKASDRLTPVTMDVTDQASIAAAAKIVQEALGDKGLDGLVNNAGVAIAGPLEFLPIEALRNQLEVNVIGQIAVTQAFLPLLRKARGRIINIGSVSGRISVPLLGPYSASKFALDALTSALRMELQPWGIHVALIEPASIATPIWRKSLAEGDRMAGGMPQEAMTRYARIIEMQRERATDMDRSGLPPSHVVRVLIHALTSPKPRTRYTIGFTARVGALLQMLPDRIRERLILRQFN